jgi:hypothetical protein
MGIMRKGKNRELEKKKEVDTPKDTQGQRVRKT